MSRNNVNSSCREALTTAPLRHQIKNTRILGYLEREYNYRTCSINSSFGSRSMRCLYKKDILIYCKISKYLISVINLYHSCSQPPLLVRSSQITSRTIMFHSQINDILVRSYYNQRVIKKYSSHILKNVIVLIMS